MRARSAVLVLVLVSCAAPLDPIDASTLDASGGCGDGVVDGSELCDVSLAQGSPGACPSSCAAGDPCVESRLEASGACMARCVEHARVAGTADQCCPAGADSSTDPDCTPTCGNGVFDPDEHCDTAIASGEGACPTTCTPTSVCATSSLTGDGTCAARCSERTITTRVGGDGCCPSGATKLDDADCEPRCGNGALEPGEACDDGNVVDTDTCNSQCEIMCGDGVVQSFERCDLAIMSGDGACPTACVPVDPCQIGTLSSAGTCSASCRFTTRTTSTSGDECCLPGAFSERDSDCPTSSCGNGIVESWERCDTAITSGSSACPTTCDDDDACTADVFAAPGTCNARCIRTTITTRTPGDGCCPSGADSRTDADCVPRVRCEERNRVSALVSDDARSLVLETDPTGALVAAWIEHHVGSSDAVRSSRRDLTTGTWSASVSVDGIAGTDADGLRIARDSNGDLVLAWIERNSTTDDIDWSRFDSVTGTWSTETSIEGLVSDAAELVLANESSGALVAAWVERRSGADLVDWSRLNTATDTWSTERTIEGLVSGDAVDLRLAVDPTGALVAVWIERNSSADAIDWSRLDAMTDTWSAEPYIAGLVSDNATLLRVTEDAGGALLALWNESHGDRADAVDWSRLDATTHTWSVEAAVDGLVSDTVTELALAHDRSGALVTAWVEHRSDTSDRIEWSRLDETTDDWPNEVSIDGLVSEDAGATLLHRHPSGALLSFYVTVHPSFGALEWSRLDESTDRWTAERSITSLVEVSEVTVRNVGSETHVVWVEHEPTSSDTIVSGVCGVW